MMAWERDRRLKDKLGYLQVSSQARMEGQSITFQECWCDTVTLPAGAREGQELRLGGVAQALPQVPQQQKVARHRPHAQGE